MNKMLGFLERFLITLLLLFISNAGYAKVWTISDTSLEIKFDDQTSILTVRDKISNKQWEQMPFKDNLTLIKVVQNRNSILMNIKGSFSFNVDLRLSDKSDLVITLSADGNADMTDLTFPPAFKTPDKNHYFLFTDGEGIMLPADDKDYPLMLNQIYTMAGGLSMPWLGITDNQFKTGYMAILDTPDDAAFRTKRDGGLITFEPVWLSTIGKFGYDRKVIYHFFDKGGYVAQCKKYREYAWPKNNVVSLRDNQKKFPAMEKMIGAVHMYLWDESRKVSFARELKKSGIDKAFILWDPNHNPYPVAGYDDSLKILGHAAGVQDLWRDIPPRDSVKRDPGNKPDPTFLRRPNFPGMYPAITLKKKDGTVDRSSFGSHVCPKAALSIIPSHRADKEYSIYPHEGWFVDVYLSTVLYECYDKNHPLTRSQYKQAVLDIYKLFSDRYKVYTGGEWGADYGVSKIVFAHGMMTLHRTWFGSDAYKRGTIYYIGNWGDARPSIMINNSTATDIYLKYSINEFTRVPLYQLVYHDAIVTTWRWEDANHKMPELLMKWFHTGLLPMIVKFRSLFFLRGKKQSSILEILTIALKGK